MREAGGAGDGLENGSLLIDNSDLNQFALFICKYAVFCTAGIFAAAEHDQRAFPESTIVPGRA